MDVLSKLEEQLENLSSKFYDSIQTIQRYAPFINKQGEENMENSEENIKRLEFEKIENYEKIKNEYDNLIADSSKNIEENFNNIFDVLNSIMKKEEFMYTEEELKAQIRNLVETNKFKVESITDKVAQTEKILDDISKFKMINKMDIHNMRYDFRNVQHDVDMYDYS